MASNYPDPPSAVHIKAFILYKRAIAGNVGAQEDLADLYYFGKSVPQSYKTAFQWYTIASDLGSAVSLFKIGNMYFLGSGVEQSYPTAYDYFIRAYKLGYTVALKSAARLLYLNKVDLDIDSKIKILSKSSELGDKDAMISLAWIFIFGDEAHRSYSEAFVLLNKAASTNSPDVDFMLGYSYEFGLGTTRSNEQAFLHYQKAAKTGHNPAKYHQGLMMLRDDSNHPSKSKALELISSAAEHEYSPAVMELGRFYEEGTVLSKSPEQAIKYYKKAAYLGIDEANYRLGELYRVEDSVQDLKKSVKYYTLAAASGYQPAQTALDQYFPEGHAVDSKQDPDYFYNMGRNYENGTGYDQSYENAFDYYTKASNLGHAEACFSIGRFYRNGFVGIRDDSKALEFYLKASE